MDRATLLLKREAAIEYAKCFRGTRYYSADGDAPNAGNDDPILGFNCSGIINESLRGVGMIGPHDNPAGSTLYKMFKSSEVGGMPQRGDLVFYGKREVGGGPVVTHVAMMIDDLHIIEAGGGGHGTDTDLEAAKRNAFVRIRPVEFREAERVAVCRIWE